MQPAGLKDLAAFRAVATAGSFAGGARAFGVTPSAMSQIIKRLENRLGTQLLHRTTRSVSVTVDGARLFTRLNQAFEKIDGAIQELADRRATPKGVVRVAVPRVIYPDLIEPLLARFSAAYPDVILDVALNDGASDIVASGHDVGFCLGNEVRPDMVAFPIGPDLRKAAVAAPSYIAHHGQPLHPRDLLDHRCITCREDATATPSAWEFSRAGERIVVPVAGPLVFNDREAAVRAAAAGLGIATACEYLLQPRIGTGELVPLLEDWAPTFPGFFACYYRNRHMSAATRALIESLKPSIESGPADDRENDQLSAA